MGDENNPDDQSRALVTAAKKLFGTIVELGVQIDSLSSRCLEVEDLFSQDLQAKRLSLKDSCESLFNLSPKSYGAIAREKLWRYSLYDAVNRARKIQRDRQWTPLQLDLVKTHLQSGIGILQLYIMKLKELCEFPEDPVVIRSQGLHNWLGKEMNHHYDKITHVDRKKTWITDMVHLCIINIGDLYRYLKEIHSKPKDQDSIFMTTYYFTGAQTNYVQAYLLRPESGLAFNQLGNLYCDVSSGLHSIYYLLYSIQSANAYEGAYSNLRQLLDRKIVQFARLPASVEPKPMDTLVNNIMSLMYHFLYEQTHLQNYERHCQEALTNFNERLVTCDPEMDETFLFHLSCICVMTVWRLQSQNSKHTSAAVAFAISIFCQLINHLTSILEHHSRVRPDVTELSASVSPAPIPIDVDQVSTASSSKYMKTDNESVKESSQQEEDDEEDEDVDKDGFTAPRRRRRCRRERENSNSESEGSEYNDNGTDFVYSDEELDNSEGSEEEWVHSEEGEEVDDLEYDESVAGEEYDKISQKDGSGYNFKIKKKSADQAFDSSSSNGHSDTSGSGGRANDTFVVCKDSEGEIPLLSENCTAPFFSLEGDNVKQKFVIAKEDLTKCSSQIEPVLVAVSPFLRFIQASPLIKDALAANAEKAFLEKFCTALNLLISQNWPKLLDDNSLGEVLRGDWKKLCYDSVNEKEVFKWELEEDRSMLGITQMGEFVNDLSMKPLNGTDMLITRIGRMVAFGSWLVSTESFSILYSSDEMNFFVPTPQTLKAYLLQSKLKRLKERMRGKGSDKLDKLSRAYNEMKISRSSEKSSRRYHDRHRGGDEDDPGGTRRVRRRRGGVRRSVAPVAEPVYAVVDLDAVLKRYKDVRRIASHRKFIVVVPHSVWKTLDMLKDSEEDESQNARKAFRWIEDSVKRKHLGVVLQQDQHKAKIKFPYPKDPMDVDAWEYYDMMECCYFIISQWLKNKPRSNETIWGDVRDKCRVFFLTGQEDLLNTKISRNFDPVKIARNVGIYVDYIVPYPGIGRGKKWKSVAKTNG